MTVVVGIFGALVVMWLGLIFWVLGSMIDALTAAIRDIRKALDAIVGELGRMDP